MRPFVEDMVTHLKRLIISENISDAWQVWKDLFYLGLKTTTESAYVLTEEEKTIIGPLLARALPELVLSIEWEMLNFPIAMTARFPEIEKQEIYKYFLNSTFHTSCEIRSGVQHLIDYCSTFPASTAEDNGTTLLGSIVNRHLTNILISYDKLLRNFIRRHQRDILCEETCVKVGKSHWWYPPILRLQ